MTDLLNGFTGRLHDLIAQIAVFIANFAVDTNYFHKVCLFALGGAAVLLVFVIVERMLYYALCAVRMVGLFRVVSGKSRRPGRVLGRRNALNRGLSSYVSALRNPSSTRSQLEDLSAAQFIRVSGLIGARLWLLDTVVTAAPLLGLLGTILGIMDTFNALSAGGISDPSAVSRGIGNALLATAIGIGVALFGLLGHNILHRIADHLTDEFKRLILLSEGADWNARLQSAAAKSANGEAMSSLPRAAVAGRS